MNEQVKELTQKEKYLIWYDENLGGTYGPNYARFLGKLGRLVEEFDLHARYKENFFEYKSYEVFKVIYQGITEESDKEVDDILKGSKLRYLQNFASLNKEWVQKYGRPYLGSLLRSYLKFLYYWERPGLDYPDKRKKGIDDEIELEDPIDDWVIPDHTIYSEEKFLSEVFIEKHELHRLISVLKNKKNLILKGAPGVGKTFIADRLAYAMMEEKDDSRILMIQFHQSYSYEDFIEGYRPKNCGDGFELKEGPFVKFARKAEDDPNRKYFFIIDEINRGNMSKIFGELMMLIEADKRGMQINLLYSNEKFSVPENLYIIGMMNTADRSLALLDYALRRRFAFFDVEPAFENSTFREHIEKNQNAKTLLQVIEKIKELNKVIEDEFGKGLRIGHSYFTNVNNNERVTEVVEYEIIPQLYEYWFDDEQKAADWANCLRACCDGN